MPNRLEADWLRLWGSSSEQFPSTHPVWIKTHLRHLTPKTDRPLLAVVGGGQTKLVAALVLDGARARFVNHPDMTDFNDFCVAPQDLSQSVDSLLQGLANEGVKTLELNSLASNSATPSALRKIATTQGWTVDQRVEDDAPAVSLPASWQAYLQSLSKKDRHELRRKLRRIEELHSVERVVFKDRDAIEAHLDDFLHLLRISTSDKAAFLTPSRAEFMRDLGTGMAEHGLARLAIMSVDSQKTAATLYFECGGACYTYNSGRDPLHQRLSNGIVNHVLGIKHAIECGLNRYDLMRGNERYKFHIGGGLAVRQLLSVSLSR